MSEILLGVQHVPQPSPGINPGGDCFACATLAMVRHFWPDQTADISVADVVEWWRNAPTTSGGVAMNNNMNWADRSLHNTPFDLDVYTDPFVPLINDHHQPHSPIWGVGGKYAPRVEAYLAAGWVGFTDILFAPDAPHFLKPKPEGGYWNTSTDHNVLIDGLRTYVEGDKEPYGAHVDEVHIVCSVKGGYWIRVDELLRSYGGLFIWWCRPRRDLPWRKRCVA